MSYVHKGGTWKIPDIAGVLLMMSLLGSLGRERQIVEFLKSRITYPRTGYVRPPLDFDRAYPPWRLTELNLNRATAAPEENVTDFNRRTIFVFFVSGILSDAWPRPWLPVMMLASAGAVLYALNRNCERPYSGWSVIALPLSGLLVLTLIPPKYIYPGPSSDYYRIGVWMIEGLWLAAGGACRLTMYLYRNRRPHQTEGACL